MTPSRWRVRETNSELAGLFTKELKLPLPMGDILVSRGFTDVTEVSKFLTKSMNDLDGPSRLQNIEPAATRILEAIKKKEVIVIHGDFDADGITSAALLTRFLTDVGANVFPYIPNRLKDNHGISPRSIEFVRSKNATLVITCDCGTASGKEIAELLNLGIKTIVTDHHSIQEELPKGTLLVNPKLTSKGEEPDDLSGVGVAFMVIVALRAKLREDGFFSKTAEPNLREYLDIVALGTLADLAPLRGQNRILVHHGLRELALTKRSGIVAMKLNAKLDTARQILETEDVGFRLAPRINAACRLGYADEALELLLTNDSARATVLADKLDKHNQERKKLQEETFRFVRDEAMRQKSIGKKVIVVGAHQLHSGVIGLVAQKISQELESPTFVFSIQGDIARGSARSRSGVDLMNLLQGASNLLIQFGGHREAGGCTLKFENLNAFSESVERTFLKKPDYAVREDFVDAELNLSHLRRELVEAMSLLKPFGVGNLEPQILSTARVMGQPREVGQGHLKMMVSDPMGGPPYSVIGFGLWESSRQIAKNVVDVVYLPEMNLYEGRETIQLKLQRVRSV